MILAIHLNMILVIRLNMIMVIRLNMIMVIRLNMIMVTMAIRLNMIMTMAIRLNMIMAHGDIMPCCRRTKTAIGDGSFATNFTRTLVLRLFE